MPDRFITDLRHRLTDLFKAEGGLPVYGFLPDDVAHLPVYVVGRPSMSESITPAVMEMTVDLMVLGRRIGDQDAQAELDAYADEAFNILGGTRGTKLPAETGMPTLMICQSVIPATVNVAGTDIPAYSLSVAYDVMTC